jgi:hypothetical protein
MTLGRTADRTAGPPFHFSLKYTFLTLLTLFTLFFFPTGPLVRRFIQLNTHLFFLLFFFFFRLFFGAVKIACVFSVRACVIFVFFFRKIAKPKRLIKKNTGRKLRTFWYRRD